MNTMRMMQEGIGWPRRGITRILSLWRHCQSCLSSLCEVALTPCSVTFLALWFKNPLERDGDKLTCTEMPEGDEA